MMLTRILLVSVISAVSSGTVAATGEPGSASEPLGLAALIEELAKAAPLMPMWSRLA